MSYRVRTVRDINEFRDAMSAIGHYFGMESSLEHAERFASNLAFERMHAAFCDKEVVGAAGAYPLQLSIPGGRLACAGTTVVGVLPNHRRRGLLTRMMRAQLADARQRGEPLAALYASQETIYERYGFGLASLQLMVNVDLHRVTPRADLPKPDGQVRFVEEAEALRILPRLYERVAKRRPGMLGRGRNWWQKRVLLDDPARRGDAGPLQRAVLETDGRPVAYALYRMAQTGSPDKWHGVVRVKEAIGIDDSATRDIWRYLLQIDWTDKLEAMFLPLDHPLRLIANRINLLNSRVNDSLWLRLIDVESALQQRSYQDGGAVTIEVVSDPDFADNLGRWTISADGRVRRSRRNADIALDVQGLGAAYLGGFSFTELVAGGRIKELRRGGAARADRRFRSNVAPWTPEMF